MKPELTLNPQTLPRVKNLESPRTGREIPNQFTIETEQGIFFQSYKTLIAFIPRNPEFKTVLDQSAWDYSTTTGKYRNQFLGETKAETLKKINSGEYGIADLNP